MNLIILQRSIYLLFVPIMLLFAALACGGLVENMQILDAPVYVCPTATPQPTDAVADGTPMPTPYPSPTPFVMRPPSNFFVGDPIYTGGFVSAPSIRLRLENIQTHPAGANPVTGEPEAIYSWQIEIRNIGDVPYEVFPASQMYVSTIHTPSGDLDGVWGASLAAAFEAGVPTSYSAVALEPGQTQTFALAAYAPVGEPYRITYLLDPTTRDLATHVPGSNALTWVNEPNTICAGDLAEPPLLPTPLP